MKPYLFALMLLALSTSAFAQDTKNEPADDTEQKTSNEIIFERPDKGGLFYLILGNSSPDMDALNKRLDSAGYPKVNQNFTTIGIGGHALLDKLVIGGELQGLLEKKMSNGTYNTMVSGGYGLVNAGYVVYTKKTMRLYPQVGMGFGTMTMNMNDAATPTFDQLLANPKHGSSVSNSSFLLNFAVAADGILSGSGGGSHSIFVFGFRAGYLWSVSSGDWRNTEGSIAGGPTIGFTGPYLQVVVGGGFLE